MSMEAIIVNTRRRGPHQMAGVLDTIDRLTGGEVTQVKQQLDTLELLLKVSIGASIVAGVASIIAIARGAGRRDR
jgi:hypothetical protein